MIKIFFNNAKNNWFYLLTNILVISAIFTCFYFIFDIGNVVIQNVDKKITNLAFDVNTSIVNTTNENSDIIYGLEDSTTYNIKISFDSKTIPINKSNAGIEVFGDFIDFITLDDISNKIYLEKSIYTFLNCDIGSKININNTTLIVYGFYESNDLPTYIPNDTSFILCSSGFVYNNLYFVHGEDSSIIRTLFLLNLFGIEDNADRLKTIFAYETTLIVMFVTLFAFVLLFILYTYFKIKNYYISNRRFMNVLSNIGINKISLYFWIYSIFVFCVILSFVISIFISALLSNIIHSWANDYFNIDIPHINYYIVGILNMTFAFLINAVINIPNLFKPYENIT